MRRYRITPAKPGELKAQYGRVDGDLDVGYSWGGRGAGSPDARILSRTFEDTPIFEGRSLRQELEARGYDITTLRFSIRQKDLVHE